MCIRDSHRPTSDIRSGTRPRTAGDLTRGIKLRDLPKAAEAKATATTSEEKTGSKEGNNAKTTTSGGKKRETGGKPSGAAENPPPWKQKQNDGTNPPSSLPSSSAPPPSMGVGKSAVHLKRVKPVYEKSARPISAVTYDTLKPVFGPDHRSKREGAYEEIGKSGLLAARHGTTMEEVLREQRRARVINGLRAVLAVGSARGADAGATVKKNEGAVDTGNVCGMIGDDGGGASGRGGKTARAPEAEELVDTGSDDDDDDVLAELDAAVGTDEDDDVVEEDDMSFPTDTTQVSGGDNNPG